MSDEDTTLLKYYHFFLCFFLLSCDEHDKSESVCRNKERNILYKKGDEKVFIYIYKVFICVLST